MMKNNDKQDMPDAPSLEDLLRESADAQRQSGTGRIAWNVAGQIRRDARLRRRDESLWRDESDDGRIPRWYAYAAGLAAVLALTVWLAPVTLLPGQGAPLTASNGNVESTIEILPTERNLADLIPKAAWIDALMQLGVLQRPDEQLQQEAQALVEAASTLTTRVLGSIPAELMRSPDPIDSAPGQSAS